MNYNLVVSDRAIQQIDKAADWFFEQTPGLEKKFLQDLSQQMEYIKENPLGVQMRYKFVRIKFLEKFDFGIHFIIENQTIFVLSIYHTHQNSEDWF
ncbi:MAG: hypothetical protein RLZZ569_615 [Bacteroidota bacterium]|jgi:plasmid stabilization system protein ParE